MIRVTIEAHGRTVTVETTEDAPVAAVVADALLAWSEPRQVQPRPARRCP